MREEGPYGHSQKLNVLMAISGTAGHNNIQGERWLEMWNHGGTTVERFVAFIRRILHDIGPGTHQRRRVFTMDNLTAHRNMLVSQLIHAAGHRIVLRAPYHPFDGPIEFVFNTLQQSLTLALYRSEDDQNPNGTQHNLRAEVRAIVRRMFDFSEYFVKCGFRYN